MVIAGDEPSCALQALDPSSDPLAVSESVAVNAENEKKIILIEREIDVKISIANDSRNGKTTQLNLDGVANGADITLGK